MNRRTMIALSMALGGLAMIAVWAMLASPATFNFRSSADVQQGALLYAKSCASCHGAKLEGQPNWQSPKADGTYPAPPHDVSGHTWHHDDAMLTDYIRRGGQAALDSMGVKFQSGMPAFGALLSDVEIANILGYIKSTWPPQARDAQAERTRQQQLE